MSLRKDLVFLLLSASSLGFAALACAQDDDLERQIETTVREAGVLENASTFEVRSPIDATILRILPAGTSVKKGDRIMSLDVAKAEEAWEQQKIQVAKAKGNVAIAETSLKAMRSRSDGLKLLAGSRVKVAELELTRYTGNGGEFAVRAAEAKAKLSLAREQLSVAKQLSAQWTAKAKSGAATLEAGTKYGLAVTEAKHQVAVAEAHVKLLDLVRNHETAALELALTEAKLELTNTANEATQRIARAEADFSATKLALETEVQKLKRFDDQIAGGNIVSPMDGVVQYVTPPSGRTRTPQQMGLQVGASVRRGQTILKLVDSKKLLMKVRVNETRIRKLQAGQTARIRLDAFPDQVFGGTVTNVNRTPEAKSWYDGNVTEYAVTVSVDVELQGLRAGMTGMAEIDVADGEDNGPRRPARGGNIRQFDKNGDGVLEKDELPKPMQRFFDRMDANKDGKIDEDESAKLRRSFRSN